MSIDVLTQQGEPVESERSGPVARPRVGLVPFLIAAFAWVGCFIAISPTARWLTANVFRLDPKGRLGAAVEFYLSDVPVIMLLLVAVGFVMNLINSYFTVERIQSLLSGRREYVGNVLAALLGVVTPFCSCSAVPMFMGFVEGGIPLGVTFSFLVSAPMVNEIALVMLLGAFGVRVALLYMASGLVIAILSGMVIGRLKMEKYVESWVRERQKQNRSVAGPPLTLAERAAVARGEAFKLARKVLPYILVAIALGAALYGYVPADVIQRWAGRSSWWAVPAAVAIGIPLYAGSIAIVPIIQPLLLKGAAVGTLLAFMMAVVGLSAPEVVILRKVIKPRLIATLVGVVGVGIALTGWMFNAIM